MIFQKKEKKKLRGGFGGGGMGDGLGGVYCGISGQSCFVKVSIKSNH